MADVVGFLRQDATKGEEKTLELLEHNLPKEYTVYVETPIYNNREIRYPDFIILTNYGVTVLEIKDWVNIISASPSGVTVRTRHSEVHHHPNPVTTARELAIALSHELRERQRQKKSGDCNGCIPWSYAAVLFNLPTSTITQLRDPWGEEFVWGRDDLSNPDLLLKRLRNTFPPERMRSLTHAELDQIRATIYPIVEIETPGRSPVILDTEQERIVAEPPQTKAEPTPQQQSRKQRQKLQTQFLDETVKTEEAAAPAELSDVTSKLSQNTAVRLVRGIAGSGKTLVLAQRAKFLAAQYPDWNLAVISYNDGLVSNLEAELHKFQNIKVMTFHKLCSNLLQTTQTKWNPVNPDGWVVNHQNQYPGLDALPAHFLSDEIKWIKDTGIVSLTQYLEVERRGRTGQVRLTRTLREQVYRMLEDYDTYLQSQNFCDWADVPHLVLEKLAKGEIQFTPFEAILVDEAQDFAPFWMKVILSVLKPDQGMIFLADDPTQSIYRYFSWKEKGIPVVGRTKWLNVPYRNTYEIYSLAQEIVCNDAAIMSSLDDDDWAMNKSLNPDAMRHGPKPLLVKSKTPQDELLFVRDSIRKLVQDGVAPQNIAVLHRRKHGENELTRALKGHGVKIGTFHAFKGLEFEAVFLCGLQETFQNMSGEIELSDERRLFYMVITRARQQLIMTYTGTLPNEIRSLSSWMDMI